jgi:hypothetical protein
MNELVALNSRDWIIADSAEMLARHVAIIQSPAWQKAKEADHLDHMPIMALTSGWSIRED